MNGKKENTVHNEDSCSSDNIPRREFLRRSGKLGILGLSGSYLLFDLTKAFSKEVVQPLREQFPPLCTNVPPSLKSQIGPSAPWVKPPDLELIECIGVCVDNCNSTCSEYCTCHEGKCSCPGNDRASKASLWDGVKFNTFKRMNDGLKTAFEDFKLPYKIEGKNPGAREAADRTGEEKEKGKGWL